MDIKWDADGNIWVRHSDIDKQRFGQLKEYAKEVRNLELQAKLEAMGVDTDEPTAKEMLGKMGAYLVIDGDLKILDPKEMTAIMEVVKLNGGILPNWSSRR